MVDTPQERQQFKLLTPREQEYASSRNEKVYNQNTVWQYDSRIRYRVVNAIEEIACLCDTLPEKQLRKIFSNARVMDLLKITEKSLDVIDPDEEVKQNLSNHVTNLMSHYLPVSELTALEELMKEYNSFLMISNEISSLKSKFNFCLCEPPNSDLFLSYKRLEKELENYKYVIEKVLDEQKRIDNYLKKHLNK